MTISIDRWGWGLGQKAVAFWGWIESSTGVLPDSQMRFVYGSIIVDLVGAGVKAFSDKIEDFVELYKAFQGETVAAYQVAPNRASHMLTLKNISMAKYAELHALWITLSGAANQFTFRTRLNEDKQVKWVDDHFPLTQTGLDTADGIITLEEV